MGHVSAAPGAQVYLTGIFQDPNDPRLRDYAKRKEMILELARSGDKNARSVMNAIYNFELATFQGRALTPDRYTLSNNFVDRSMAGTTQLSAENIDMDLEKILKRLKELRENPGTDTRLNDAQRQNAKPKKGFWEGSWKDIAKNIGNFALSAATGVVKTIGKMTCMEEAPDGSLHFSFGKLLKQAAIIGVLGVTLAGGPALLAPALGLFFGATGGVAAAAWVSTAIAWGFLGFGTVATVKEVGEVIHHMGDEHSSNEIVAEKLGGAVFNGVLTALGLGAATGSLRVARTLTFAGKESQAYKAIQTSQEVTLLYGNKGVQTKPFEELGRWERMILSYKGMFHKRFGTYNAEFRASELHARIMANGGPLHKDILTQIAKGSELSGTQATKLLHRSADMFAKESAAAARAANNTASAAPTEAQVAQNAARQEQIAGAMADMEVTAAAHKDALFINLTSIECLSGGRLATTIPARFRGSPEAYLQWLRQQPAKTILSELRRIDQQLGSNLLRSNEVQPQLLGLLRAEKDILKLRLAQAEIPTMAGTVESGHAAVEAAGARVANAEKPFKAELAELGQEVKAAAKAKRRAEKSLTEAQTAEAERTVAIDTTTLRRDGVFGYGLGQDATAANAGRAGYRMFQSVKRLVTAPFRIFSPNRSSKLTVGQKGGKTTEISATYGTDHLVVERLADGERALHSVTTSKNGQLLWRLPGQKGYRPVTQMELAQVAKNNPAEFSILLRRLAKDAATPEQAAHYENLLRATQNLGPKQHRAFIEILSRSDDCAAAEAQISRLPVKQQKPLTDALNIALGGKKTRPFTHADDTVALTHADDVIPLSHADDALPWADEIITLSPSERANFGSVQDILKTNLTKQHDMQFGTIAGRSGSKRIGSQDGLQMVRTRDGKLAIGRVSESGEFVAVQTFEVGQKAQVRVAMPNQSGAYEYQKVWIRVRQDGSLSFNRNWRGSGHTLEAEAFAQESTLSQLGTASADLSTARATLRGLNEQRKLAQEAMAEATQEAKRLQAAAEEYNASLTMIRQLETTGVSTTAASTTGAAGRTTAATATSTEAAATTTFHRGQVPMEIVPETVEVAAGAVRYGRKPVNLTMHRGELINQHGWFRNLFGGRSAYQPGSKLTFNGESYTYLGEGLVRKDGMVFKVEEIVGAIGSRTGSEFTLTPVTQNLRTTNTTPIRVGETGGIPLELAANAPVRIVNYNGRPWLCHANGTPYGELDLVLARHARLNPDAPALIQSNTGLNIGLHQGRNGVTVTAGGHGIDHAHFATVNPAQAGAATGPNMAGLFPGGSSTAAAATTGRTASDAAKDAKFVAAVFNGFGFWRGAGRTTNLTGRPIAFGDSYEHDKELLEGGELGHIQTTITTITTAHQTVTDPNNPNNPSRPQYPPGYGFDYGGSGGIPAPAAMFTNNASVRR